MIDNSGSKLSLKVVFPIKFNIVPTYDHSPQKHIEGLVKKPTQGLLLIHSGIEATLAITMIHSAICNMGNKTLSTRRYSARLTRHKQKIK